MAVIGINWADVWKPVWKPVWTFVEPVAPTPTARKEAGRSKLRRVKKKLVITIDGDERIVSSYEEAEALLDEVRQKAEATAQVALERATASKRRPVGKVLRDARKTLDVPEIQAPPEIAEYAAQVIQSIRETYQTRLRDIEIQALLHRQQQQEEDDEDILLLIA